VNTYNPMNERLVRQNTRGLWVSAGWATPVLLATLVLLADMVGPQTARAQTAGGTPAAGSNPGTTNSSGFRQESPAETIIRLRGQSGTSSSDWPPPSIRPETPIEIARKLQTGEYTIDRNESPLWYQIAKIALLVITFSMFIVSLVVKLVGKSSQHSGPAPAQDDVRKADALADTARAKYKNLVRLADRKNFVEQRQTLATEGAAVENLFRQAAALYRAAAEKFDQAADPKDPPASGQACLPAQACSERARSQSALAEIAALLRDSAVTSPEQFSRRAEPLLATANSAAENSRRLMEQAAGGESS
jgi:hypothetical protein